MDFDLPRLACTTCGYVFDATTGLRPESKGPDDGSVSVCINCGGLDIFVRGAFGLSLRPTTQSERIDMMADELIVAARAEIIGRGRIRG
ncbi:hypothetical protein SEA_VALENTINIPUFF_100 [Microbacterium phage ValentiniPuff]|uniref:Uncharacterized protein n=1 Tax=Microbacterium phage ValentiniPuff TaxID=2315705 RepID=A0A386KQX0_9CAUD|nr:hypothetical protein SEA_VALENTINIPUFF_100 [Microbacterium phage ValentiniPuff]